MDSTTKKIPKPHGVRIDRYRETEKLYSLEARRQQAIDACVSELLRVLKLPKKVFWTVGVPLALLNVLDSWDTGAAQAAAAVYLETHSHRSDADCERFVEDDGRCYVCGVVAGDPCPECGGKSFHVGACVKLDVRPLAATGSRPIHGGRR